MGFVRFFGFIGVFALTIKIGSGSNALDPEAVSDTDYNLTNNGKQYFFYDLSAMSSFPSL